VDVTLLRWPSEWARREQLRQRSLPRLLLIEDGHIPPASEDCLEDWIRVPAPEKDVQVRLEALEMRASQHMTVVEPTVDLDGVLRYGQAWVPLPPVEARLTRVLIERLGAVVSRDALASAGWPHGAPGRNALDVHVLRLRRRVAGVGLVIRTVRSRGYLLEPLLDASAQASSR